MIIPQKIDSLNDWKEFISKEKSITNLAKLIIKKSRISADKIERINIGTNAVFDLGKYILKIYAVNEKSHSAWKDCKREIILSNILQSSPYQVPAIVKTGYIHDRYIVHYNIIEKINGLVPVSEILCKTNSLGYTLFLKELHNIIHFFHSLNVNSNIARMYSKPIKKYPKEQIEYTEYLHKYLHKNHSNYGIVHGDLTEFNIYFNEKNEIVILDFEDWMYAPSIVEYPTICFELLKELQIISDFFENMSSSGAIEMLIAAILLHRESIRFLKMISLQIDCNETLPSINEMRLFLLNWFPHRI